MKNKSIIKNQKVTDKKKQASRKFRKKMTEAENSFWEIVRNRRMYNLKFRRQQVIDGFIVDFFCNEIGLVVEIDGGIHNSKNQIEYDIQRTRVLERRGLKVLRIANNQVLSKSESINTMILEFIDSHDR
jgi:very-short-patch-repair endonuclease